MIDQDPEDERRQGELGASTSSFRVQYGTADPVELRRDHGTARRYQPLRISKRRPRVGKARDLHEEFTVVKLEKLFYLG